MRAQGKRIAFSLLSGTAWTVIPYLLGRTQALERISSGMAKPGVVVADSLLGESIHGNLWEIPLSFALNLLIASGVAYLSAYVFLLFSKKEPTGAPNE
jgi:hypothetical protein